METQKLGQDNGKDPLVNIADYLRQIGDCVRSVIRKPTGSALQALMRTVGCL